MKTLELEIDGNASDEIIEDFERVFGDNGRWKSNVKSYRRNASTFGKSSSNERLVFQRGSDDKYFIVLEFEEHL